MPKRCALRTAAYALAFLPTQTKMKGGLTETDENADAVKPTGPSAPWAVTTTTPLAKRDRASRNAAFDSLMSSVDVTAKPDGV